MNTVTVKEFSQEISDFINRVAYHGESFTLLSGKTPLAEIRPVPMGRKLGDLPKILKALPKLPASEMNDFEKDLAEIRKQGNKEQLANPWES